MNQRTSEAVEAHTFLQIYEAFEDASRRIQIPVRHLCPIRKVVWSSFDYMSGPELGFTWEAVGTTDGSTTSSNRSSLSGCSRDGSSITSSTTKGDNGGDYEDIDDVYELTSGLPYDSFKINTLIGAEPLYLGEFMADNRSTVTGTTTMANEDRDEGMHSVILSLDSATYKANSLSPSQVTVLTQTSSLAGDTQWVRLDELSIKEGEESEAMVSSGVDSGIAGTVSVYSDLSNIADSSNTKKMSNFKSTVENTAKSNMVADDRTLRDGKVFETYTQDIDHAVAEYDKNIHYEALYDLAGDNGAVHLSDEEYVAKFVLAEQICSTPMPSNPVIHKLTLLPTRHLFVGSYLFQAKGYTRSDRAMYAVSLLGDFSRWEWYTERQNVIEEMFVDIIPRIRISFTTESMEDFVCRTTKEISKMFLVLGICEYYPLLLRNSDHEIRLRQTYFGDGKLRDNLFLAKAITAVLLSQSHCVVVGDVKADVAKMLLTLWLFVAPEWRWLCTMPHRHPYSPYLRLQNIERNELSSVMYAGVESHWPPTIIDLDRRTVSTSSPYPKHRALKFRKQKTDIIHILKGTGVDLSDSRLPKIELRNCHADPRVKDFLIKMDLLPFESSARLGFIRQFKLLIENSARAFIAYVRDVSEFDSHKQYGNRLKWSLRTARKSLDLINNSTFLVTLAEAERIVPDFANFLCDSEAF